MTRNEGKCCDAVIRCLEARTSGHRSNPRWPEDERHKAPIEFVCEISGTLFAFEHTLVEPFMDQKKMDRDRGQLLDPVIERVAGKLPPDDHFLLRVPIELTIGLKTKDIPRIQDALVAWIVATAPTLKTVSLGRLNMPLTEVTPHGVPFKVSLHRSESGGIRMGVHYVAVIDENRVATLAARVAKACDDKLGKLFDWKRDDGARTVLVLEQDNLAMGNPANLSKALVAELATRGSATPDEVYYVGTYEGAGDWSVICLLRDGARWPDPDFQQFDPAQLHSITSR